MPTEAATPSARARRIARPAADTREQGPLAAVLVLLAGAVFVGGAHVVVEGDVGREPERGVTAPQRRGAPKCAHSWTRLL